jgi:peptide/nickel transport system substrate-binding protein
MNPLLDRAGWNEVSSVILSRLFRPDHQGNIVRDLVDTYLIRDGGRIYELNLRQDVTWHDGTPFTADDVFFTWQRLFDRDTLTSLDLNQAALNSHRQTGKYTIEFELKQPDTGFLAALTEIPILPAHRLENADINGDAFDLAPIGTGPYRLVLRRDDREFHLLRHDKYHLGRPAFDELVIKIIADDDARARAVASGEADIAHVKPPHVESLRAAGKRVFRMATGAWRGMPLNLARVPLADMRVRQAIDLAIDREAIVKESLAGYGSAAYSPIPPASWAYLPEMNAPRHDPAQAARLLDNAGWRMPDNGPEPRVRMKNGASLDFEMIVWKDEFFRRTAAQLVALQLGAIGFKVNLHLVDGPTYNRLAEDMGADYDAFIGGWGGLLDPGDNLYKKYHSRGSQNRNGYIHRDVNRWLEEARRTINRPQATALYHRVVKQITTDAVFLPIAYPDYLFAARPDLAGIDDFTLDSWYEFTKYAAEWSPVKR